MKGDNRFEKFKNEINTVVFCIDVSFDSGDSVYSIYECLEISRSRGKRFAC